MDTECVEPAQQGERSCPTATASAAGGPCSHDRRRRTAVPRTPRAATTPWRTTIAFSTGEIHPHVTAALGGTVERYTLSSLRYDLSKLRAKGLVEKLPRSRRYRLPAKGYAVCLIFLKLVDRLCAPLTAGLLSPVPGDAAVPPQKRSRLDRLYQTLTTALDRLTRAIGLAPTSGNENKIPVGAPITA